MTLAQCRPEFYNDAWMLYSSKIFVVFMFETKIGSLGSVSDEFGHKFIDITFP